MYNICIYMYNMCVCVCVCVCVCRTNELTDWNPFLAAWRHRCNRCLFSERMSAASDDRIANCDKRRL